MVLQKKDFVNLGSASTKAEGLLAGFGKGSPSRLAAEEPDADFYEIFKGYGLKG